MKRKLALLACMLVAGTLGIAYTAAPTSAGVNDGARTCADIDSSLHELKLDNGNLKVGQVITDGTLSVTITAIKTKENGSEVIGFTGTSNIPVVWAILKAGTTSKVYGNFAPNGSGGSLIENPNQPPQKGTFLYTPFNDKNGTHYGLSYVSFCY